MHLYSEKLRQRFTYGANNHRILTPRPHLRHMLKNPYKYFCTPASITSNLRQSYTLTMAQITNVLPIYATFKKIDAFLLRKLAPTLYLIA